MVLNALTMDLKRCLPAEKTLNFNLDHAWLMNLRGELSLSN